jgi:hypothetical protein
MLGLMLLVAGGGCQNRLSPVPSGGPPNPDAHVFEACETICLRPADCAIAYNDDGICPPGYLCARTFSCSHD